MTPPRGPVTGALLAVLRAGTGRPGDYGQIPTVVTAGSRVAAELPFWILDPLAATFTGPSFGDRHADAEWPYQIRAAALRMDQAEWVLDKVAGTLTARNASGGWLHPLVIAGQREVEGTRTLDESGITTGEPADGMVTLVLRFSVTTSPSV